MDVFDADAERLVRATQLTCDMGVSRSISKFVANGRSNPKSGKTLANGLWLAPRDVIYRCGVANVFTHEITCHAWNMGCACKSPHPELNC